MRRRIEENSAPTVARAKSGRPVKRNVWQPQIIPPFKVDLPMIKTTAAQVVIPASISGRSLIDGRL